MAPNAIFNIGTKIAVETDRGSPPSGVQNRLAWWSGGRWADVITDGLPNFRDRQAIIFPTGMGGTRAINQQPPVIGRKWAEGDFSAPVVADFLAMLLYGAMGAASSDFQPHATQASAIANLGFSVNPTSFTIATSLQPAEGGAILRFELKGGINSGQISISGIDVYGNGASEILSFASGNDVMYSRNSYSSIGAGGIAVSGVSTGSITIVSIKQYTTTFTTASSAPTISLERIGDPTAGNPSANLSFVYGGLLVQALSLENDSQAPDGVFMMGATLQGEPTSGTCGATTLNAPSLMKIWPSWMLRISRDNNVAYNKVSNFSLAINTNNRNFFAATGSQAPAGGFIGGFEATGKISILVDDEVEYQRWKSASITRAYCEWGNNWKLTSALNMRLSASIPMYFEGDLDDSDSDGAHILTGDFRVPRDEAFPFQFQLVSGVPGTALSAEGTPR